MSSLTSPAPASKRTGVVYTPPYLAAFVVDRLLADGRSPVDRRWLDPACGNGVFLTEIVRRFSKVTPPEMVPEVVSRSVFGVDIDPEACEMARLAVRAEVAKASGPLPSGWFKGNVQAANFLDPSGAEDFDLIVGNPPYVSAQLLTLDQKRSFRLRFATAWGRLDLYTLFIERGLSALSEGGALGFITPDKWLVAKSSARLRSFVGDHFRVRSVDRFERHDLFRGVSTVPCVTVIDRPVPGSRAPVPVGSRWWGLASDGRPEPTGPTRPLTLGRQGWTGTQVTRPDTVSLGSLVDRISVGLATGLNRCFVLDAEEAEGIEPELLRPVARGRDVRPGRVADSGRWLLIPYVFGDTGKPELIAIESYPLALAHLSRHRSELEDRHCVRVWKKAWYDLHDPVGGIYP